MGELNESDLKKPIVNVLDFGVIADGKTDCTAKLNECLEWTKAQGYSHVWLPSGTYVIDAVYRGDPFFPFRNAGIRVPSHICIDMASDAVIKVKPNDSWGYAAFYIGKVQHVTIRGGRIEGDRDTHVYKSLPSERKTHEWGFGVCIEGASHVNVHHVQIQNCTGDGIIVSPHGLLTHIESYSPASSIHISGCTITDSRRNNISITGCDGVIVEDCLIERAGVNGVEPKMGIDIEGYGENATNLEEPLNIQIRNNIVRGGAASAIYNFNGYGVIIEGNQTDSSISYGFATETIIANNLIRAVGGGVTKAGITSLGVSLDQTENNVIIIGNMIEGFEKGIDVRGDSVHITGNKISLFEDAAVSVYMANRILIEGNHIESGTNTRLRSASLRIYQSDSIVFSNNTIYSVIDAAIVRGTNILIRHNQFKEFSRGIWVQGGEVGINGNHFIQEGVSELTSSYTISVTGNAKALIWRNRFKQYQNYAVYSNTTGPLEIKDNSFEETSLYVVMYIKNGSPQIGDNRFYLNRSIGQPTAIFLDQTVSARVLRNNIINFSPQKAIAFRTMSSTHSVIAHNVLERSQWMTHNTDRLIGNIEIDPP
ncbi:right-handed parallel beta-helix repeat-containing protein [Bacillus xiamenensis]|uniref:Right-handed parallel beta-helix repeat-containing protein n=1 Tax=Bacillus xiamenensis TaxID=1178537 RepID=A0ABT4F5T0_9BACI|nr:right-handed parallel beta-helix repeat-containing protein [Bacillus xiamenensis]MCY9577409.1 right-handed parallel beta-helix repeat-containing protein [Bacillus xiamenensis]